MNGKRKHIIAVIMPCVTTPREETVVHAKKGFIGDGINCTGNTFDFGLLMLETAGWLIGCLLACLLACLLGRLVGWLVGWSVGWLVG